MTVDNIVEYLRSYTKKKRKHCLIVDGPADEPTLVEL